MPDDQQGESILKKYGFSPPGAGGEVSSAPVSSPGPAPVQAQAPPEEPGGILQKYGFKSPVSPAPAPPPPPAATAEVKPPVAPVQPPQPAATQEVQPGTPPPAPVSPAAQPSPAGVKPPAPGSLPEALAPSSQPVTAPAPQEEIVPTGFGGEVKPQAPPTAPATEGKPLYAQVWDKANQAAANIEKPVIEGFHGLAQGFDDLIARGGLLAQGEWKAALMGDNKPVPAYLSQITGAVPKAFGVEEAAQASSGASKFVGGLIGGLAAYMIPGGASAKFAKATEAAPLAQKFIFNLLTFATTDTLSAAGRGESPEQVRAAFLKSIPTAALFTIAQAVPFDRITKSPWMQRALESTATGTAFAGSHALGGETDPLALATSFATGFLLHGVQSTIAEGLPQRQKEGGLKIDWAATEQTRIYNEFKKQWMEENKIGEDQFNQDVQPVLDEVAKPLYQTPQPEAPTAEAQKEAIFGGALGETIEAQANRADAVRALVPQIGDQARAERFYDLYKEGDAATALKEFPEMSAWATEQQKAAQKAPDVPAPMASSGATTEAQAAAPAPEAGEVRPAASADMVTSPAHAVNPAGRENTTETPAEAAKLSESPAPKASPELEPPSSAPAQAGGGGTVGLSATPAGEVKPVAVAEPAGPPTPMGSPGSVAEAAAKPPGVEEFMGKFGSRQGPPDVGMTAEPLPKVWRPPSKRSRTYDFDRAAEHGDIDTMILSKGGFDSKSEIFNNFEPEERLKLFRYMRSKEKFPNVKGPDVMFHDLKEAYPHLMPWESEADWLMGLIRGDHKKALMGDKVYEDLEAQHDYNLKQAKREGYSPEDVAAAEAELERQIAAEELAGRSAKPGEHDTSWDTATFGLSAREKPASKLNTRLDELATEYPDIDREKAATVLRAFPDAANNHIAAMSADPEMFNQVAQGNLAASEKAQLLKKATDAGAQQGLPGMEGEAGKLFKVEEEATPTIPYEEPITFETVKREMGKAGYLVREAQVGDASGYHITLPSNKMIFVITGKEFAKPSLEEIKGAYPEMTQEKLEKAVIAGEWRQMSLGGIAYLAKEAGVRTFRHEVGIHAAADLVLTAREMKAVLRDYGDWETAARAYEDYSPWKGPENAIFRKIWEFYKNLMHLIRPTGESTFAKIESGEVWLRKEAGPGSKAAERGLPEALAPGKYRVEEGGEWGMEGGLVGRIKGDARAAREEGRAAKDWLMSLFASNRTSKEALKTHQIIAGTQAESTTEKLRMQNVFMKYVDGMGPIKGDATQEFLRMYESGQEAQITHPVFKAFGEEFRAEERRHMEIMTMLGDAPKEIPNYIDHLWKENDAREQLKAQLNAQVTGGRSMRGPDYYKLLRTVVDIPSGIKQGLEPRFDTLPEMVLAGRSARENRIAATKRLKFIKENGYEKVVRDVEGGKYTVTDADGKDQEFKSINEARRFATDNPGSSDPRFEPDVPQGWEPYPGGYGEVWAKIKRPGGAMIPGVADEETLPMGGGPERAGYVEVPKVDAWSRVGYRVGPKDVVRQFENFLGRGLSGNTAFELYQSGLHAVRHSQMALSFFHAFFESINAVATHAGSGIFDSLGGLFTGDWQRMGAGLKTVATSPLAPWTDIGLGLDINKTLMKNGVGIPGEATDNQLLKDARTLVGGGMRPEAESQLAKILTRHFKEAWKLKGTPGKAGYELLQGLSSPTMEVIVPFSKQGSTMFQYLNEVKRWERENPGVAPTEEDLRNIAYECRQTADYIYGRMAKDNVAMNAMVKSLLTGVLQFPTWQFGTVGAGVRSMIGAKDVVGKVFDMMQSREIRKLDIKDRQALQYVTGLLFTVGMTGALMTYAFTGKPPETMADYFFPKTGEVNPNGSEERLQLPSYFKDAMGIKQHFFKTVGAKLASPIHILTDLIENKDYWGAQIRDPHDWIGAQGIDVLKYMAKTTAPFALQSYEQGAKGGPGRFGMSLLGVRPVPRETANTPLGNVVDEYNQIMRASTTTKESAELKKTKSDLMKLARDQDEAGFQDMAQEAVSGGKLTRAQVKEIVDESQVPAGQTRFYRLPIEWMARAMEVGSDYEREQYTPIMLKKIANSKPEILIRDREALAPLLEDMGFTALADKIKDLELPEQATQFDLTGLGITKPAAEMGDMTEIDQAIADILAAHTEKLGAPKKPKSGLRLPPLTQKESDKKRIGGFLGV